MNLTFPMFSFDGPIFSLDDEEIFHRLISRFLPAEWQLRCFTDQEDFKVEILRQLKLQEDVCSRLSDILHDWRTQETSLISSLVKFWHAQIERPASLVLIDFRMPYSTGVELLSSAPLKDWGGIKLLLTAHADDRVAVDAFNRGLISQFISKGALAGNRLQVIDQMGSLRRIGNNLFERTWASQIDHDQQEVVLSIRHRISALIEEDGWQDFAVIGQPFGVLARRRDGSVRWLQLETQSSLPALVDVLENIGISQQDCCEVRSGQALVALEIPGAHGKKMPTIDMGSEKQKIWGALFDVDPIS